MPIEQLIVLALVQGLTEFLPISSSGHLILIPELSGWQDQGLATDVMVHVGSLFAILAYFWRDVIKLACGTLDLLRLRWTLNARLAAYIAAATVPAIVLGLIFRMTGFLEYIRGVEIVAWNALVFGLFLLLADMYGPRLKVMEDMKFAPAMMIGLAQALALIPGTSRSGITMTAARFLGFERAECARFSFLLGIPAIAGAGTVTTLEYLEAGNGIPSDALLAALFTFFAALFAIAFLMAVVKYTSFLPFVIYRAILGVVLLAWIYGPGAG